MPTLSCVPTRARDRSASAEPRVARLDDRLGPACYLQFGEDAGDVVGDSLARPAEPSGDGGLRTQRAKGGRFVAAGVATAQAGLMVVIASSALLTLVPYVLTAPGVSLAAAARLMLR